MYILTRVGQWSGPYHSAPNMTIIKVDRARVRLMLFAIEIFKYVEGLRSSVTEIGFYDSIEWVYSVNELQEEIVFVERKQKLRSVKKRKVSGEKLNVCRDGVYWSCYLDGTDTRVESRLIDNNLVKELGQFIEPFSA